MARAEMPHYPQPQEQRDVPAVLPARGDRRPEHLLLDAGRMLILCGAFVIISAAGSPATANVTHTFLGLVMWLLGVSLLTLMPVARRFPRAALVGAAVADAVLNSFFPPWN